MCPILTVHTREGTLAMFGWGCATVTPEPLAYPIEE